MSSPLRILEISFLTPYESSGGLEKFVFDLGTGLHKEGFDVSYAYVRKKFTKTAEDLRNLTVYVPGYLIKRARLLTKIYYNFALFFLVWARKDLFNIVHINGDNGVFISLCSKIKTVMTFHGSYFVTFSNYKKAGIVGNRIPTIILGNFEIFGAKHSNELVSVSGYIGNYFHRMTGKEVRVIYPPVDSNTFRLPLDRDKIRSGIGIDKNTLVAIWAGGTPIRKGLPTAINAVSHSKNVVLYVLGTTCDSAKNVVSLGRVNQDTLIRLFQAGDVFLFPSLSEGFSIAVIESMLCGLVPILRPFFKEIFPPLIDGLNSFLPESNSAFKTVIDRLSANRELLIGMRNNLQKITVAFSYDQVIKDYSEIFEEIYRV